MPRRINALALGLVSAALAACCCYVGEATAPTLQHLAHTILDTEPNAQLQALGEISDANGSLARTFMSPAHRRAAKHIQDWMQRAGMDSWIDAVGNVHGQLQGSDPSLPMLVIGSHYDTVLDAGKFDGPLGIVTGIAAVKMAAASSLLAQGMLPADWETEGIARGVAAAGEAEAAAAAAAGAGGAAGEAGPGVGAGTGAGAVAGTGLGAGAGLRRSVRVVAFSDEEGVRFQSTFLGSRALAGTLIRYDMLQSKDKQGLTLAQVLQQEGLVADAEAEVAAVALRPEQVSEYVEVHMEQGPVLEAKGAPLGVVSAIAGQTRMWLSINGTQGHAGTVPMRGRGDALAAAAEVIQLIERRCGGGPHASASEQASESDMLVCTVGELHVWPGASNVIPGNTQLSIDIRSKSDGLRDRVVEDVTVGIQRICGSRGVTCGLRRTHDAAAVLCADDVVQGLKEAIKFSKELWSNNPAPGSGQAEESCTAAAGSCREAASPGTVQHQSCSCADTDPDAGGDREAGSSFQAAACSCLATSARRAEGEEEVMVMVSGAGHDAMAVAEIAKMGMMFVRCRGGVSHSPLEHVEPADVAAAAAALYKYILMRAA